MPVRPPDTTSGPPDLTITAVGLNADGNFTFIVTNRGSAVTQPFKVNASLDGYLRETVQFNSRGDANTRYAAPTRLPFGNGEERRFTLAAVKVDLCSSAHSLKVVADIAAEIGERNETNNEMSWSGPTPCPTWR